MGMRISVVIPAYNAGRYIGRALDSVLAQTRPADEIIVVDDGSTDNTAEVVAPYGEAVRFIQQENAGASVARNTGITAATCEWIAFLDADDEWLADKLHLQAEHLQRHPDLAWTTGNYVRCYCGAGYREHDLQGDKLANVERMLGGGESFDSYFSAHRSFAGGWTGTMVIRREAMREAGLFRPGQLRINDMDMWFQIAYRRPKIGFLTRPLAIYHTGVPASIVKTHRDPAVICDFIDRHLALSAEHGVLDAFEPCAAKMVGWWIHCCIVERRGREVRTLLKRYGHLYGGYYRVTMLVKSFFPRTGFWYDDLKCRLRGGPTPTNEPFICSG
ncbi:MAG: glycosyltransferase family 2 protein [Phycisphaerae bacterium]|nr:glycosyltransferase family 2 protein [Phycisphaerae bacterium]